MNSFWKYRPKVLRGCSLGFLDGFRPVSSHGITCRVAWYATWFRSTSTLPLSLRRWSAIGILSSVCLSVTLCILAKWYVLQQVSEQENRKCLPSDCPPRNTILQLSTSAPTPSPHAPTSNHRRCYHLANTLKYTVNIASEANRQNFHV